MAGTVEFGGIERYAGDAAWEEWFARCSVGRCSPEAAARLRAQIESALYTHLNRAGFTREDVEGEDPVLFFDSYFQLKGSRDSPKPLKAYFAHRIRTEGLRLRDFVCGTLFGAAAGRVRDIVSDWIAVHKGWKARTVTGADGKRHAVWESAGEDLPDAEGGPAAAGADPAAFLDEGPLRAAAREALERVAGKTRMEKSSVALLSFAMAQDIPFTAPAVLAALGVGKSRAYLMKTKVMKAFGQELRRLEGSDDPLFGRLLLETCERAIDPGVRRALEEGGL